MGGTDTRRLVMRRINVKIKRRKSEAEKKENRDVAMKAATHLGPIKNKTLETLAANSISFSHVYQVRHIFSLILICVQMVI